MTFASHLFAFGFGFICAIGAVLGVFYFILLKAIAKNEKNFANKNLNGYQDTQTATPKEERNSSTQSQSQNASTVTKIEPEKSQEHTQIIEKSSSLEGISDPAPTPELQRADSQEKRLQQTDAEKKPMDPIHMAVKSKKPNNASSSPAPSRMSYNQNDEVMISGWLKIRGYMNVWWNRWCIVKDGKFVEYRNEKKDDCFAIVLLAGCEISMRESSKKGFSFRISHPTLASIYSSKGLKGENLTSAKFPGNTSECIIRAQDEHEAKLWMSTVEKAIAFANQTFQHNLASADEEADERIAPVGTALGTPTYGISPPMDDQDGSEDISTSSSPPMMSPSSPSQNSSTPIGIPKPDTPLSIRTSMDDAQSVVTETESSREEYPKLPLNSESDKNLNLKSSIDIEKPTPPPEVTISTMHTDPLRDIMSGEESEELSATERSASQDFPQHVATNENRAVNTIVNTQVSISEPLESGPQVMVTAPQVTTSSSSSISSGVVSALPQKEGWMELKQGKMWKMYWFVLNNGMLTYFETEKSTDCSGLIDLDGCKAIQNDVNRIDVSHPTNKAIHFLVNSPESAEKPAASPTPSPNLEASFDGTNNNRTLVQLRTERYDINKKWLKSIEQEIIFIEGKSKAPLIFPKLPPYFESRTEKCHWFNVFIKRYFKDIRNSQVVMFLVKGILTRKFDRIKKPDYIGNISIDDIQMGNEAITIKEVVIGNTDNPDELVGEAEIQYDGGAGLTISTEFFINFPRWHFATVPVVASVKLTSMSGRVIFYAPSETNSSFSLSFTELPKCEFAVNLTVGDKHKYDVSRLYKVSDFVVSVLKKILWKNTVMPNRIFFSLPLPGRKLTVNTKTITSRRQQEQS